MLKIVHVTWHDPCFASSGWMSQDDFQKWIKDESTLSDSVGFLVYESDSFIVLVQSIGKDQVADGIKITRSAIVKINEITTVPISLS